MPKTTGDGLPGGDDGDLCNRATVSVTDRIFLPRRLKQVFFVSGISLLSAVSVFALSPKEVGPAVSFQVMTGGRNIQDGKREICALYLERRLLASFGKATTEDNENVSRELDSCREIVADEQAFHSEQPDALEAEIRGMVTGYPIEAMAPFIAEYDREIAGLVVGIAKKESDWGNHVPTLAGQDCFNYWGYKGEGSRGTAMGYACFGSPEEAVSAVGDRISRIIATKQASNPEQMLSWKCGSSCAGHSPESVRSWVASVRVYYDRLVKG